MVIYGLQNQNMIVSKFFFKYDQIISVIEDVLTFYAFKSRICWPGLKQNSQTNMHRMNMSFLDMIKMLVVFTKFSIDKTVQVTATRHAKKTWPFLWPQWPKQTNKANIPLGCLTDWIFNFMVCHKSLWK